MAYDDKFFNSALSLVISRLAEKSGEGVQDEPKSSPKAPTGADEFFDQALLDDELETKVIGGRAYTLPVEDWGELRHSVMAEFELWLHEQRLLLEKDEYDRLEENYRKRVESGKFPF